jgi:hypothetical protein
MRQRRDCSTTKSYRKGSNLVDKAPFQAYCIDFDSNGYEPGLPPGITLSHTFVGSPNHNWNCFGQGTEYIRNAKSLPSGAGLAYEQWASNIYGPNEGKLTDSPAAGLHAKYDGVCHNAANRLLVLAGADVSDATGNALAILMYGKYGFNIPQYIQAVKDAAQKVNTDARTIVIPQNEVDDVVARIKGGAASEIDTLVKDIDKVVLRSHFEEQLELQNLSPNQLTSLRQIYSDFQEKRLAIFNATEAQNPSITDIQAQYAKAMKEVLKQCLEQMLQTLEEPQFLAMFQASPEQAIKFLLG